MPTPPTILFAGSSQLRFSEDNTGPTIPDLTIDLLNRRGAGCVGRTEVAYPLPGMWSRIEGFITESSPVAVVLFLGTSTFVEQKMQYALHKKSRFLYRLSRPAVNNLKVAAGGGTEGGSGLRGLLFRAPRRLGRALIGTAPLVEPEVATANVHHAITVLAAKFPLIVIKSTGTPHDAANSARSAALRDRFNEGVGELCASLAAPCLDLAAELPMRGDRLAYAADGIHLDLDSRHAVAAVLSERLEELLAPASPPR